MRFSIFALILLFSTVQSAFAASVESFSDIQLWFGSGAKEAAIAIDFDGASASDESLVWGFRWDGDQTVEDMLFEVVGGDSRLFANLSDGTGLFGRSVFGLGYDADGDRVFGIDNPLTNFSANGIAISGGATEGIAATDPGDLYEEGFMLGFFELSESVGNPFDGGSFTSADTGISGIILDASFAPTGEIDFLEDGQVTSLAWNDLTGGFSGSVAQNFVAATAVPEPSSLVALAVIGGSIIGRRRKQRLVAKLS